MRRAASYLLAAVIGIAGAAAIASWALEGCTTDTECGCTTDCLEAP